MKKLNKKIRASLMLAVYLFGLIGSTRPSPADGIYTAAYAACDIESGDEYLPTASDEVRVSSRLYELFFGKNKNEEKRPTLIPGGSVFGLMINEDGVTVTGASGSPSLISGDRIIAIDGRAVTTADEVNAIVAGSGGARLDIEVIRAGQRMRISTAPRLVDERYTLGVSLRSRTAGIGTLTFIDPQTLSFGGLGHGIGDSECGGYVRIKDGTVTDVTIGACKRGEPGRAGELTGILKRAPRGNISINNECGVFGALDALPTYATAQAALPIAYKGEVTAGTAEIISTVKGAKRETYRIEIYDVDTSSTGSKSFKIRVTDPTLISLTGGIVRGMSGSPIIQNGKLVGAVTHVLVANPTEGYGIFIENMLNAAQNQVIHQAA